MTHLIIASADTQIAVHIQPMLLEEGYRVTQIRTGASTLLEIRQTAPALLLIDAQLGDMNGLAFCRNVRKHFSSSRLPILFLETGDTHQDRADALNAGADQTLHKPFAYRECAARIRALLRRQHPHRTSMLSLDSHTLQTFVDGREVTLTPTEFELLWVLSEAPGKHITADELLHTVWNFPAGAGDTALVRNHIRNLRLKLELDPDHPQFVVSRHGRGYALAFDSIHRGEANGV